VSSLTCASSNFDDPIYLLILGGQSSSKKCLTSRSQEATTLLREDVLGLLEDAGRHRSRAKS